MSNSPSESNTPSEPRDPAEGSPASPGRRVLPDLVTALAVAGGLVGGSMLLAAVTGSPSTGAALGLGLAVPAVALTFAVLRRRHRDPLEFTDERARLIDLRSRATGFLALVGLLWGVFAYRFVVDGYAAAQPYVEILLAGVFVQLVVQYSLKSQS